MRRALENRGVTLIELLLYLAIASVFLVVLSSASIDMLRASDRSERQHEINQRILHAAALLQQIASEARAISEPAAGEVASMVRFRMNDPARDPTVFALEGGQLWFSEGEGDAVALHATSVRAEARFTGIGPTSSVSGVHASMTLRASSSAPLIGAEPRATYETAITLPF